MIDRLRHYFLTYKLIPGEKPDVKIDKIYNREHALKVVEAAILDYKDEHGD
jgi:inorganic pyrophosphatase